MPWPRGSVICIPRASVEPKDIARFFRSVRPRRVSLNFGKCGHEVLTYDVLSALSHGGCLERLTFPLSERFTDIGYVHLQRFCRAEKDTFPTLRHLDAPERRSNRLCFNVLSQCNVVTGAYNLAKHI